MVLLTPTLVGLRVDFLNKSFKFTDEIDIKSVVFNKTEIEKLLDSKLTKD